MYSTIMMILWRRNSSTKRTSMDKQPPSVKWFQEKITMKNILRRRSLKNSLNSCFLRVPIARDLISRLDPFIQIIFSLQKEAFIDYPVNLKFRRTFNNSQRIRCNRHSSHQNRVTCSILQIMTLMSH